MRNTLLRVDTYINAVFQLICNTLRKYGVRALWIALPLHAVVIYLFLLSTARFAAVHDMISATFLSLLVLLASLNILHAVIDLFQVAAGNGDLVDKDRNAHQERVLELTQRWWRPVVLVVSVLNITLFVGFSDHVEPLFYGMLLYAIGEYLETCV